MPDSLRRTSRMLGWRCRAEGGQLGRRASLIGDWSGSDRDLKPQLRFDVRNSASNG